MKKIIDNMEELPENHKAIRNEKLASQVLAFDGMIYKNKCRPTDIDFLIEFRGKLFIYGEAKRYPAKLTTGQRRALAAICDNSKNPCFAFFFHHFAKKTDKQVPIKDLIIKEVYSSLRPEWKDIKHLGITVDQFVKELYKKHIDEKE
jgi:hypothetical protein